MSELTGIIPFKYTFKRSAGSTFIRADGLINTTQDFSMWKHGHKFDNLIFQKVYWREMMEHFKGPKILDLCDPDWINGTFDIIEIGTLADAITCSSPLLTELVKTYFLHKPVIHVPDRFDFSLFPAPREAHGGMARDVIWFGYINNAHETLLQFAPLLKAYNLKLTIISDQPYSNQDAILDLNPQFIEYNQATAFSKIKMGDIILNPKSEKGFFKYKSNNKTVIGWRLGLPVAERTNELERFLEAGERNREVAQKQQIIDDEYHISKSAIQYREIIKMIKEL